MKHYHNKQGRTLVVSWLLGNPPQHSKGKEAHWKSASTATTNNLQVGAWYYNQQCNEVFIVLRILSQAKSSQKPVERPSQSVSDRQSARASTSTAVIPYTNCQYGQSFTQSWAWFYFFASGYARAYWQKPPSANPGYAPAWCSVSDNTSLWSLVNLTSRSSKSIDYFGPPQTVDFSTTSEVDLSIHYHSDSFPSLSEYPLVLWKSLGVVALW